MVSANAFFSASICALVLAGDAGGLAGAVWHPVKTDKHNENASKTMNVAFIAATIPPPQAGARVGREGPFAKNSMQLNPSLEGSAKVC